MAESAKTAKISNTRNNLKYKKRQTKSTSKTSQYKELLDDQINLLATGLKFIPTPVTNHTQIRWQLLCDFNMFSRMRLQYIFHGKNNKPHSLHVKSTWEPPIQQSVGLEGYLERIKSQLFTLGCNLVVVVRLGCLNDPKSCAGCDFSPWQV